MRVDKRNHRIRVCPRGVITYKSLPEKRGLDAMTAVGIIPRYGGVIVHDCWASYLSITAATAGAGGISCASSPSSSSRTAMPGSRT